MKLIIVTILTVVSFVFSVSAQDTREKVAPGKTTEAILHVEAEGGKTLDLTAKDLSKFTRREVKAAGHDNKESVYSGYNLSEILLAAAAKIGKDELSGKELASYLLVEATDGYRATFAIAEIAPEFTDKIVLLADMRDGKPLPATEAPWQLIVPGDKKHGRWVRQVTALKIKKAL